MGLIREPLCTARAPALLREAHVTRNPMHSTKYTLALALLQRQHTECECTSITLRLSVRILSPAANFCSLERISWKDIFRNWAVEDEQRLHNLSCTVNPEVGVLRIFQLQGTVQVLRVQRKRASFLKSFLLNLLNLRRENPTELCLDKSIFLPLGHRRTR